MWFAIKIFLENKILQIKIRWRNLFFEIEFPPLLVTNYSFHWIKTVK